jgi:undecaprenyl diphosphate synthase
MASNKGDLQSNKKHFDLLPKHVAVIMDGNGRWAQARGLPRYEGHTKGVASVEAIISSAALYGIEVLTLFAFGKDNWNRSPDEVQALMRLYAASILEHLPRFHAQGIRVSFIGDTVGLGADLVAQMMNASAQTINNEILHVVAAINYSGRWDITQAVNRIIQAQVDQVSEQDFSSFLQTSSFPDPDLLIRSSGEQRLSNFLLWPLAYTELFFTETYWPDFSLSDFELALAFFQTRQRRFGCESPKGVNDYA